MGIAGWITCGSAPKRTAASRIAAKSIIAGRPLITKKEQNVREWKKRIPYEKSCIITWLGNKGNSLICIELFCQFKICCTCLFSIEILFEWRTVDSSRIRRQKGNCARKDNQI